MNGHDDPDQDMIIELGTSIIDRIYAHGDGLIPYLAANMARALDPYVRIQNTFPEANIAIDEEFQRDFRRFYRLRFPEGAHYQQFFDYFEETRANERTFEQILDDLQNITGRVEASFASKLLHTIDTLQPIIDSRVLAFIGFSRPQNRDINRRIQRAICLHQLLSDIYAISLADERWAQISEQFDEVLHLDIEISEQKKLDTLIWQYSNYIRRIMYVNMYRA